MTVNLVAETAPQKAITDAEFSQLMASLAPLDLTYGLAVAVSGGPDSMALAFLVRNWLPPSTPLKALIIDHRLRSSSSQEAEDTKKNLALLEIDSLILPWIHAPIQSRIHLSARRARYALLLNACQEFNLKTLLLAHHRDDQAETILMRFAKGSGVDGLSGMPKDRTTEGIRLLRPFLECAKERLVATCVAHDIPYVLDPSNSSSLYARGRLRRVMPLLEKEGLTVETLCDLGNRAREVKDALDVLTQTFLDQFVTMDVFGVIKIVRAPLSKSPRAIIRRVFVASMRALNHHAYPPMYEGLTQILDEVMVDAPSQPRTLYGCLINALPDRIVVLRELAPIVDCPKINPGETVVFDERWRVSLSQSALPAAYEVRPLGNPSHEILDELQPNLRHQLPQGRARASLPSLWVGDELRFIPQFSGIGASPAEAILVTKLRA